MAAIKMDGKALAAKVKEEVGARGGGHGTKARSGCGAGGR